jgi:hypothetical protein
MEKLVDDFTETFRRDAVPLVSIERVVTLLEFYQWN